MNWKHGLLFGVGLGLLYVAGVVNGVMTCAHPETGRLSAPLRAADTGPVAQ